MKKLRNTVVCQAMNAVLCPECKTYVYSCAPHDFRHCPCGAVAIDGGPVTEYYRVIAFKCSLSDIKHVQLKVPFSEKEMYDDWNWNSKKRKLGHVPITKAEVV